ncbi:MAG: Endonuclease [uncultured Sulfurovum sp.]|uniref:Endonuclease n=1 Tax=uncultured Sulfurovum sp. TaxID=269237 RepID=A0A6S6TNU3_9BACT|nr:MAG: Endonuclease [uncultured Sulfurovum sp.]
MSMECLAKARKLVKSFLDQKEEGFIPEINFVEKLLRVKAKELEMLGCQLSKEDIELLSKDIHSEETISIPRASTIMSKEKEPWLHTVENPSTYYSDRYRNYLTVDEGFSRQVVDKIFKTTDETLDFMTNPHTENESIKKGLVMGNVQSGKTANYLALINRAADVGYKLIILIAGIHNNLRTQTQARVNSGFIGFDTVEKKELGVSKYNNEFRPFSFTSTEYDFNKDIATSLNFNPKDSNVPVILVIKKNMHTLKNLLDWLGTNNTKKSYSTYPLLVIDDEADNASINTKKNPDEVTTINRQIRQILKMFKKRSYVGYTATPFANIFINPESKTDEHGDDLFPEDFIVSLESPSNYIGAEKIFNSDNNILRTITDNEVCLDVKLKAEDRVDCLPESLYEAVNVYLLTIGTRKIRKNKNLHSSMLVNVSFRVVIQEQVKELINEYLQLIKQYIQYNYHKSLEEMIKNDKMKSLYNSWVKEFSNIEVSFEDVLDKINENKDLIKVFLVNSKKTKEEKLNYDNYKDVGLNAITIGGYSLSRGFTIEGLTVSYFLRNSQMYDTLLQMGRWFGYRAGYEDLCRIYMREEAIGWYRHISEATEELKEEFKVMNDHDLTPREYGLKVKNHDESLIITARNKMYHSSDAIVSINYYGELIETRKISNNPQHISLNMRSLKTLINSLASLKLDSSEKKNFLWRDIDVSVVLDFIKAYKNHPLNIKTDGGTIEKYLLEQNIQSFDVAVVTNSKKDSGVTKVTDDISIYHEMRSSFISNSTLQISGNKSRVGSISDEKIGLSSVKLEKLKKELGGKKASGVDYRKLREKPLLILHILKLQDKNKEGVFPESLSSVVAYGISFPGHTDRRKRRVSAITYKVNKTWLDNNFIEEDDEDED